MSKELTITGKIPLPADELDAADTIHGVRAAIAASEKLIGEALGGEFKFEVGVAVTRGPRNKADGAAANAGNKS